MSTSLPDPDRAGALGLRPPAEHRRGGRRIALAWLALALALAGAMAWWWWRSQPAPRPHAPPVAAPAPAAPAPPPEYALQVPESVEPLQPAEVQGALARLLGSKAASTLLHAEGIPRRVVATVDNLGRSHAPPALWPVHPTAGRFSVREGPDGPVIDPDNAQRYTPLVLLAESVDAATAVDLYVRMVPLLQQAYEELGFPNRQFHQRLIQVIDQLLATPEPREPIKLQLTQVKGPHAPSRSWVRYEFADPALESLSAGQKIMLRVGTVNQRRLKARLKALRQELVARSTSR